MKLHHRVVLSTLVLLCLSASICQAARIYVKPMGNDSWNGMTWYSAKKTIAAALSSAGSSGEVWVARGQYAESITVRSGVGLYGGFLGNESSRSQRNWATRKTMLDGTSSQSTVTLSGGTISGFTIRNKYGGAGVDCSLSSGTIADNAIVGCVAAISCDRSSVVVTNNIIRGNRYTGVSCSESDLTLTNNTIANNGGPGISYMHASSLAISNNIIAFNGSGVSRDTDGSASMAHNCVFGNGKDYDGLSAGATDISADPRFACADYGDLHIQPDSPCRDAGDDAVIQAGWLDMDCQSRTQGAHVDIGAAESDGTQWPTIAPVVVRVSPTGSDSNDGSSWTAAKKTIQAATDAVMVNGGEVWVKTGVYRERPTVLPYVSLYGGFAGTETARDQRNLLLNITVLNGDSVGSVVRIESGGTRSCLDGFIVQNGGGNASGNYGGVLSYRSSATIANNTVERNEYGGIACQECSRSSVVNNVVSDNGSAEAGGIYLAGCEYAIVANNTIRSNAGTGIYCDASDNALIANNTVSGNGSDTGGGIYCRTSASPVIANNLFAFNASGVYCYPDSAPILTNNCVYGNTSFDYSGIAAGPTDLNIDPRLADASHGSLHIQPDSPCRDAGNDAIVQTGWLDMDFQARAQGPHVDIGADESDGTEWPAGPFVTYVSQGGNDINDGRSWATAKKTVQAGIAVAISRGQEVWVSFGVYTGGIILTSSVALYGGFSGNETERSQRNWKAFPTMLDGTGSGSVVSIHAGTKGTVLDGFIIRHGGGTYGSVYCSYSYATISNNVITGNNTAGVNCAYSPATISNNMIKANVSGIMCDHSSPTIANNTISGNSNTGMAYTASSPVIANNIIAFNQNGIYQTNSSSVLLQHNCVYGNMSHDYSGVTAGATDISADPQFMSTDYGDCHIRPNSPCRDAGDDTAVQECPADIDGQARVQGDHVDIGADESDGTEWTPVPVVTYVSAEGNDANSGSSWASAKNTIQAGIDATCAAGGEVWVKTGAYSGFTLFSYVTVCGGFAGNEAEKQQRDWRAHPTTVQGAAGISVSTGSGKNGLDGLRIVSKGVSCRYASLTISNCDISGNSGSGVSCYYSRVSITGNTINANTGAQYGGGVNCDHSSVVISNNLMATNGAGFGSGIACDTSTATIVNNTIVSGTGPSGGSIYCNASSPVIRNNIIALNASGIRQDAAGADPTVLENNCVYGNTSYNYQGLSAGASDISADPLFARAPAFDYHLTTTSPCIDKGFSSAAGMPIFDMDGEGRVFGGKVDIGADEFWPTVLNIAETRKAPDGAVIKGAGAAVSGAFPGSFYVEADSRASGIRVEKAGFVAEEDRRVTIAGEVQTSSDGERYIAANTVAPEDDTFHIKSFAITGRDLGGGDAGLSNIGLLVTTFGTVRYAGDGFFYVDDGSALDDGSGHVGVKVSAAGLTFPSSGLVKVTGISSCEKTTEGKIVRLLRVRKQEDIVPF